jgi:hypothetical protein
MRHMGSMPALVFAAVSTLLVRPATAAPVSAAEAAAPVEAFWAIVERPLFRPDRRPAKEADGTDADTHMESPEPMASELRLRLVGTVIDGGRAIALVELDGERGLVRLAAGDRLGDWQVIEIGPDSLLLSDGSDRRRWTLLDR